MKDVHKSYLKCNNNPCICKSLIEQAVQEANADQKKMMKDVQNECTYPDCHRVHYFACRIHGIGTHDHNTKGLCSWEPIPPPKDVPYDREWKEFERMADACCDRENKLHWNSLVVRDTFKAHILNREKALVEEIKKMRPDLEYIATRNEQHNAVCIPRAKKILAHLDTLLANKEK